MKNLCFLILLALLSSICDAQVIDTIQLPEPIKQGGKPLMQALDERHSSRNFTIKDLTLQQLADMLWAANGINRPDGRRTAPSARNKQEIDIYLTTANGVFIYDAVNNVLICISREDIRAKTGGQPWVKDAAVNILYICNKDKAASSDTTGILVNAAFTAGACAQNIYLYCASEGLGSVVRGSFRSEELNSLLKLSPQQLIIMAQTVGWTK
jgi:nitroreductase